MNIMKKIKILFYIDELQAGGAEKVLCNLVNNMDQNRFDVTVHTTYKCEKERYLKQGIRYRYVYAKKNALAQWLYRLETALGLFYSLHLKDAYNIEIAYLECGPTKVIAQSTNKDAIKLAWVHCDLERRLGDTVDDFVKKTKKYYNRYDKVICVSDECRKSFTKLFGLKPEALVIHNTIDADEILEKSMKDDGENVPVKRGFTLVTCGRLTVEKNYMMLLKCMHELGMDNVYLWIIGDGEERKSLQNYIEENQLESKVKLLGFQSNPYPILKLADLYVCSSKYEGYSTAVIEALILGIPVITTDCSGMYEILGQSEYGLITENDEKHLSEGLDRMISDSELFREYRMKAKERGNLLSGRSVTKETEKFFEQLIG